MKSELSNGRLTKKKLIKWINDQFIKFDITGYEAFKIEQTRYRPVDYEAGAAQLNIWVKPINEMANLDNTSFFMCFYRISELGMYAKKGAKIGLRFEKTKVPTLSGVSINVNDN